MADLRAIVTLPFLSGKPEDVAVNVLHFSSASSDDAAADVIAAHVAELFNVTPPVGPSGNGLTPIAAYISNAVSRAANACSVKVYDLADAEPRIPRTRLWTLGASLSSTAKELPAEVALAVSIWGVANRPRTRGRIYFGPLTEQVLTDDAVTQRSHVSVIIRETFGGAVKRLIGKPANTQNLGIWSRGLYTVDKVPQAPVPGSMTIATNGWVDDAWDTQRRRGQESVLRYQFAA